VVGAKYTRIARVFFGDKEALAAPEDDTRIRAKVPYFAASQTVDVVVRVNNKESAPKPFRVLAPGIFPVGRSVKSIATGDFNGDGNPDLAAVYFRPPPEGPVSLEDFFISIFLGNGDVNGTFQSRTDYRASDDCRMVAVGDLDGDSNPDLVAVNDNYTELSVFMGNGDGTFHHTDGDLDGSGVLDLAVISSSGVSLPFSY